MTLLLGGEHSETAVKIHCVDPLEVMNGIKLTEPLRPRLGYAVKIDADLKRANVAHFAPPVEGAPIQSPEEKAEAILQLVSEKVSAVLADETLPGRQKYVGAIVRELLDDAQLKKLLSGSSGK